MDKEFDVQRGQGIIRRPEHSGLRFLELPTGDWQAAFTIDVKELNQVLLRTSTLNTRLPRGGALAAERALLRRKAYRGLAAVLRQYGSALRAFPEVRFAPGAQALVDEAGRIGRYESVRAKAGQGLNAALDLRLAHGGLQWYMLQKVLQVVVARMESPDCPRAERERLQSRFSRLLLRREALLMTREQRKATRDKRRKEAAIQLAEVEQRTLVDDTMESLRQGRQVDPATLEQAARAYREMNAQRRQAKTTAEGPPTPAEDRATRR